MTIHTNNDLISVSLMASDNNRASQTQAIMQQISDFQVLAMRLNFATDTTDRPQNAKVSPRSAAMMPGQISDIGVAEHELKNTATTATQHGAALKAIHYYSA